MMKSVKPTTEETEVPYPSAESSVWVARFWYSVTRTGVAAECAQIGALLAGSTDVIHASWTKRQVYAVVEAPGDSAAILRIIEALIPKAMQRRLRWSVEGRPDQWDLYDYVGPSAEVAAREALGSRHQCVTTSWGCMCGQLGNRLVLDKQIYREVGQMVGRGAATRLDERSS